MRNRNCKPLGKTAEIAMFPAPNMVSNYLNLLAIPAGFEPATIGLEGPKPSPEFYAFAAFETVNRTRQQTWEFAPTVNGDSQ